MGTPGQEAHGRRLVTSGASAVPGFGKVAALSVAATPELAEAIGASGKSGSGNDRGTFWFDRSTGILLRAEIPQPFGRMVVILRKAVSAPAVGTAERE